MFEYVKDFMDWLLEKFGYIDEKEYILRSLPKPKQKRARRLARKLSNLKSFMDVNEYLETSNQLTQILKDDLPKTRKKTLPTFSNMYDVYNYKPATSRLYNLFASNPFGAYAYVARHHSAVRACISTILDEINNDGYVLISEKGVTKKRLKDVYRKLKSINLPELRSNLCKHLKIYGNAWILPHTNLLGGKSDTLQLLSPTRILPDIDPVTEKIKGWFYRPGSIDSNITYFPLDKVWHLRLYSVDDYRDIGDPPLAPALLDIEADMAASAFNNQVFQKGGLLGVIISVKVPEADPLSDEELDVAEDLQERINTQFSGAKAGQSVLVSPNIDNVYNPVPIGGLDSSFKTLHYEVQKTVAICLGVPPEKIAVSRSETLQYIPSLVEDSVNTSFDKAINTLVSYVDDFINETILREYYGITDIRIQAGGRWGSLTKNAADTIKALADSGPIITVNDALEKVLGWEPLPPDNPRGNIVLDNSQNRKMDSNPQLIDPEEEDLDLGKSTISSASFIKWCEMRQGSWEVKDKTYSSDDAIVHRVIINKWGVKYYENISGED